MNDKSKKSSEFREEYNMLFTDSFKSDNPDMSMHDLSYRNFINELYDGSIREGGSVPHYHNCHEIYLLITGSSKLFRDKEFVDITPGTVALVKPFVPHRYAYPISTSPNMRFVFNVSPQYMAKYYSEDVVNEFFSLFENNFAIKLTEEENKRFLELIYEFDDEYHKRDFGKAFLPIGEMFSIIARHSGDVPKLKSPQSSVFGEMIDYIYNHFTEPISLDTLEKVFFIGRRTINDIFKKELGTTPAAFITDLRIQNAMFLLTRSDYSFRKISNLCGFSSLAHFSQAFTRRMKISPTELRKKIKNEV